MFKNMTIKMRLYLFSFVSIVGIVIMSYLVYKSIHDVNRLGEAQSMVSKLEADMLMLRRDEKDFLARKSLKYKENFLNNFTILQKDVSTMEGLLSNYSLDKERTIKFLEIIKRYKKIFIQIINLQEKIGLNPHNGLYGALRDSVHKVQNVAKKSQNYVLLSEVYELRKYEKDFMLRRDMKYVNKFQITVNKLIVSTNGDIKINLVEYSEDFLALVNSEKEIGLNPESGLRGKMRNTVHKTELLLSKLVVETQKLINTNIDKLYTVTFILSSILVLMMFFVALIISKNILNSLKQLENRAEDLAHGDGDLTQRLIIVGEDEITIVSNFINAFIEKVQDTIVQAKETSDENSSVSEELARTSLQIGKKVEEESIIVGEVSSQGKDLQSILTSSIEHAKDTEKELNSAEVSLNSANHLIVKLADEISIRSSSEAELADKLSSLSNDAQQVKGVLEVIGDIADQTNLLALNAAIEAARAGEHGRGFAVVADEVRKLAERTQKSLSEINATISIIVQSITDASDAISLNAVEIEKLSENANEAQGEISSSVNVMEIAVQKVDNMVQGYSENGKVIQQMIDRVETIKTLSVSNARSVEEIASASDHLSSMTGKLNDLLASYKS